MTFLNLNLASSPSGHGALPSLRTVQYLLTYTLDSDRDWFAFLPPLEDQFGSAAGSGVSPESGGSSAPTSAGSADRTTFTPETGSGTFPKAGSSDPITRGGSFQFGEVLRASESNIASLNDTLEWEISSIGMKESSSPVQTDLGHLASLLTSQNDNNTIPCSRLLIAVIEEDIENDLANTLLGLLEMNPALQVIFFNVNKERISERQGGTESEGYPNIERVLCSAKAALEDSTVDERNIANRSAVSVQSLLNYLSLAGDDYKAQCSSNNLKSLCYRF